MELIIILFLLPFAIIGAVLPVLAFWKICSRVGFNEALGLLMLVPVANIVLPLYVAFASWPALERESGHVADIQ
ncbi:MAG: hypothetical protein JW793_05150 [Acidobacteria bacterium]|nr:hypothetical protein [Acidobacteriota bacterium]